MIDRHECNGRLARVVEYNGVLYLSGRTCGAADGIRAQTEGVLRAIEETLNTYGSDKRHILKAQIFLKDIARDFQPMNEVWESGSSRAASLRGQRFRRRCRVNRRWLRSL